MNQFYEPWVKAAVDAAKRGDNFYPPLRELPASVYGRILTDPKTETPKLAPYLPRMPPNRIQVKYNGRANQQLLPSSVGFLESMSRAYTRFYERGFPQGGTVMDYGCGWGRLIRMAYWLTDKENIYAFDPQEEALKLCRSHSVEANLALCDQVPTSLPLPEGSIDLAYSFSVFTHLSERAGDAVMKVVRRHVKKDGLFAITIRPVEFWKHRYRNGHLSDAQYKTVLDDHKQRGFAYVPTGSGLPPVDGEVQFGDTSMTLDYIVDKWPDWELLGTNMSLEDLFQVQIFLRPRR